MTLRHDWGLARFPYATFRTKQAAEAALDDMWATGEVSDSDQPKIEKRKQRNGTRFVLYLAG